MSLKNQRSYILIFYFMKASSTKLSRCVTQHASTKPPSTNQTHFYLLFFAHNLLFSHKTHSMGYYGYVWYRLKELLIIHTVSEKEGKIYSSPA